MRHELDVCRHEDMGFNQHDVLDILLLQNCSSSKLKPLPEHGRTAECFGVILIYLKQYQQHKSSFVSYHLAWLKKKKKHSTLQNFVNEK